MFSFLKPVLNFIKKAFIVVAVYFVLISLFAHFISKDKVSLRSQGDPIEKNRQEIYKVINDPQLNKTKEGKLTIAFYRTAMCGMIGEACTNNPKDGDKNFEKSAFGFITKLIVFPYVNPPASGVYWAYSGLQSAGFIPKSYAAEGIGFAAIKPFTNLWKIFRDLSYMLLVLVLISIGFMVMFRMKMNPQTVISVESALPKIVVSLILITFSFAIAGFLIDLMYVSIVIIVAILGAGGSNYDITNFQNRYLGASMGDLFKDVSLGKEPWYTTKTGILTNEFLHGAGILNRLSDSLFGILPWHISYAIRGIIGLVFSIWFGNLVFSSASALTNAAEGVGFATAILGGLGNIITDLMPRIFAYVIFFVLGFGPLINLILIALLFGTLLFLVFRIFAMLFYSYIKLLLLIIISPFLLMFEAIPGKSVFSWWIKNLISNLICFPITIAIFLIGFIIVNNSTPTTYTSLNLPYLNGIDVDSFKILIGVGLVILIPELVKLTREVLGIKDLPINLGIGTFFGGAGAVFGGATGLLGQVGSFSLGLQAITGKGIHEMFAGKSQQTRGGNYDINNLIGTMNKLIAEFEKRVPK